MSYFESCCTESEYLQRLNDAVNGFSDGGIVAKYLECSKCGEIIINLLHAKYHDIKFHNADWKTVKGD
jgi:hypothetical protein